MRLAAIYGHKWTSAFPTPQAIEIAKREWKTALKKVEFEDIGRGVEQCKYQTHWPPSLPEFLGYCHLDFGLPELNCAYREACMAAAAVSTHEWSHPAVYHAAKAAGFYELRQYSESQSRPLFERSYAVICRRIRNGETLEKPVPLALPENTSLAPCNPSIAKKYLTQISDLLKRRPNTVAS